MNNNILSSTILGTVLVAASWAVPASRAHAFTFQGCCNSNSSHNAIKWSSPAQTMKIVNQTGLTRQMTAAAINTWNNRALSSFRWTVVDDDDPNVCLGNDGQCDGNEFGIMQARSPNDSFLAITTERFTLCETDWEGDCTPGRLVETDVQVFLNFQSGGSTGIEFAFPPTVMGFPNANNYVSIAAHEIGHAMGLDHVDNGMARMESNASAGGWHYHKLAGEARVMPLADDCNGIAFLYPATTPSFYDGYAQSYQHVPTPAGVNHEQFGNTASLSLANGDVNFFPRNRTPRSGSFTRARPGDIIDMRVCFGNRGNLATPSGAVSVVLSRDDDVLFTPNDDVPAGSINVGPLQPRSNQCLDMGFFVPSNTPRNATYHIGYVIATGERSGDNVTVQNRTIFVE